MPYGDHQHMIEAQEQAPLPQVDPLTAAFQMPSPGNGLMNEPFDTSQPVTAGMPFGPGPNTTAPNPRAKLRQAEILAMAAESSGNPRLAELAARMSVRTMAPPRGGPGGTVRRSV
jgi:hypothetical protein